MGKNKTKRKSKKSSSSVEKIEIKETSIDMQEEEESETDITPKLTLEALDAISDEEDDGPEDDENAAEWNAEAKALRQAIAEGAFDKLLSKGGKERTDGKIATKKGMEEASKNDSDSEMQEVALEDDSSSDEDEEGNKKNTSSKGGILQKAVITNPKALDSVTEEQEAKKYGMAWAETFDVIPKSSLPFGANGDDGNPLDVHDDLKREVAFYNLALEAVHIARDNCKEANIPFTRPVDFFAEMVKTDGTYL